MDFNIVKIGAFIILIAVYFTVRKLFKKFADFTENLGNISHHTEELEILQSKVTVFEEQLKDKP
ncbi:MULTISPECIES: hypothetical protein [Chryseobacterium]|uniref:Uncharacterized protein n=1 Tax=Chryseobacterium endophyticum TaxID=1854762 RepID=A0AAU6WPE0_9FLAO|nr:hypothetical protein [uncultured Chryseobacterium sp.]